jgi:hypothetical protein
MKVPTGSVPALGSLCAAWLALPLITACSSSSTEPAKTTASTATNVEWNTLLTGDWQRDPGTEGYTCVRKTNNEDLYVNGFEAINPLGTHHTLLTMGAANGTADGTTACTAADNHPLSVFGSGVGTNPLQLPEGIAIKIPKDTQLLLNLHLFNTRTEPLTGTSGTRVHTIPEKDVVDIAEGLLAGTVAINVPAGQTKTTIGHCTMSSDVTIIAVAPHMHQLGVYEKIIAESNADGDVVLHDAPYDFNEQSYHLVDPLQLAKGDKVRVECTHHNTTTHDVTFGDSSLAEMCFAGIYRYPADGSPFICMDGAPTGTPPTPTL